jgi:hypothetical protein
MSFIAHSKKFVIQILNAHAIFGFLYWCYIFIVKCKAIWADDLRLSCDSFIIKLLFDVELSLCLFKSLEHLNPDMPIFKTVELENFDKHNNVYKFT